MGFYLSQKKIGILLALILLVLLSLYLQKNWDVVFVKTKDVRSKILKKIQKDITHTASRVEKNQFISKTLNGEKREFSIYIPTTYDITQGEYPALYLLHGFPGSDEDWLNDADLQATLDKLISEHKIPPMIVVFPDGNGSQVHDSQYLNATLIQQPTELYILELVSYVDSHFRTIKDRKSRAIGGLSSGGYGALNIGLHHNNTFAYILSHSGYGVSTEQSTNELLEKGSKEWTYNMPNEFIKEASLSPETYIYHDVGKDDKDYLETNVELDKTLTDKGVVHSFRVTDGAHSWDVWKRNIVYSLTFLGQYLHTN